MAATGWAMAAALAMTGAAPASAQGAMPDVVRARVGEMVAACARAGGKLGTAAGQGAVVLTRDFTGDGRMDFLVSEGSFPCSGRPDLFRSGGRALVQLYAGDGNGGATLAFADALLGYRVLDGRPARLQIARAGPACGGPARCGDELRWNGASRGFQLVPTDGRGSAPVAAATDAVVARAASAPVAGPAPASVGPQARQSFDARCRAENRARYPQMNAANLQRACADGWGRVEAAAPVAEALLAAVPLQPGEQITAALLRQRLPQVRWSAGARPHRFAADASGRLDALEASVTGAPVARVFALGWSKVEADPPYDVAGALAARGARVQPLGCYHFGPSEVNRVYRIDAPGRPPFALETYTRTAALGGQESRQVMSVDLTGKLPTLASLRAEHKDPAWNANCPY